MKTSNIDRDAIPAGFGLRLSALAFRLFGLSLFVAEAIPRKDARAPARIIFCLPVYQKGTWTHGGNRVELSSALTCRLQTSIGCLSASQSVDEILKMIRLGTSAKAIDHKSKFMVGNSASLESAHDLQSTRWSGGNRALPMRQEPLDYWESQPSQENLVLGALFESGVRGRESDRMHAIDLQRIHRRLIAEGYRISLAAVAASWVNHWKQILGLTTHWQWILKQTQSLASAIKRSATDLGLVTGPTTAFWQLPTTD